MSELISEREGETKRPQPNPNLPQMKQMSSCQQAKYDRAISEKLQ